jgi:uncharacterized protein DUF2628
VLKTFVVYEPESTRAADSMDRAVFVREKFSWTAFFFAPVWLLFKRLWLAFVLFCAAETLIACGLYLAGLRGPAALAALLLPPLVVAFEGAQLQRFRLQQKDYRETDVVIANDLESAERRYFERRKSSAPARAKSVPPAKPATLSRAPRAENSILGLFPTPWRGK